MKIRRCEIRNSIMGRLSGFLLATGLICLAAAPTRAQENAGGNVDATTRSGWGWSLVHLDVDVYLMPQRGTFKTKGVVTCPHPLYHPLC